MPLSHLDLLIAGGGPIGIACGAEAARRGLSSLILEKSCLLSTIHRFPPHLVFFSTPQLLEIAGLPFITASAKPSRNEVLHYYRRVCEHFRLDLRLYEAVLAIERGDDGIFIVETSLGARHRARNVVLATGFYDHPNLLGIPGESLPKVSHYLTEPHPHYRRKVAVIGGQNSAAEAALELYRNGAEVTLIHRGHGLGDGIKYWVRPDIENRIREGSIRAIFGASVVSIDEESITVSQGQGLAERIENQFVLALTGYHADFEFLARAGIALDPVTMKPIQDPATLETGVPGLYVAGVAAAGWASGKVFIENARLHAIRIADHVKSRTV